MKKIFISIIVLIIILISFIFISLKKPASTENKISLDEKIGQMLLLGFRGYSVDENSQIIQDINNLNLGGVILFDYDVPSKTSERNIQNYDQVKQLISDIKTLTNKNLFIAVDAEGGYVNRLKPKYGFLEIKSAQNMEDAYEDALPLAQELNALGFNLNFAPVVDVNINPDNPVIGGLERSFGDQYEVVEKASDFIDAMHENNIITAIKHFPGHGSSTEDSHLGLVDITNTYQQEEELYPYYQLKDKTDMVMTAHVVNQNIDENDPATLSPLFLQNLLRNQVGFNGVIVSDDMQMGAIVQQYGLKDAITKAINAGCNLLIFSNNNDVYDEEIAQKAFQIIKQGVEDGTISEELIDTSYQKIQELKEDYNL